MMENADEIFGAITRATSWLEVFMHEYASYGEDMDMVVTIGLLYDL